MSFFSEIDELKKDFPKYKTVSKKVVGQKFNGYQIFSLVTFCICIVLGVILGNLFPACGATSSIYSNHCANYEFNFFLMIFFWLVSLILCLFFYAIGDIIKLLSSINNKIGKK